MSSTQEYLKATGNGSAFQQALAAEMDELGMELEDRFKGPRFHPLRRDLYAIEKIKAEEARHNRQVEKYGENRVGLQGVGLRGILARQTDCDSSWRF